MFEDWIGERGSCPGVAELLREYCVFLPDA